MRRLSESPKPAGMLIAGVDLTTAEAHLLGARGLLHHVLFDLWTPEPPRIDQRICAAQLFMRPSTRAHAAVLGLGAAWIHGAASSPPELECAFLPPAHRHKLVREEELFLRPSSRSCTTTDCVLIGGLHVTTPLRTCVDLAQSEDPIRLRALHRLMAAPELGCSRDAVLTVIRDTPYLRHRSAALARVRSQDPGEPSSAE